MYNNTKPSERAGDVAWINKAQRTLEWLSTQPGVYLNHQRFKMLQQWRHHGYDTCWWSGLQTVITPDGRVWACLNKRGFDSACIGDLSEQSFSEIWENAPVQCVTGDCRVMCRGHIPNLSLPDERAPGQVGGADDGPGARSSRMLRPSLF